MTDLCPHGANAEDCLACLLKAYRRRWASESRALLDWQRDACKVLETAACECDEPMGFRCLRCRLLQEVHPDQRSS